MFFAALSEALSLSGHVGLEGLSLGTRDEMITHATDRRWRRTHLLFNVFAIDTIDRECPLILLLVPYAQDRTCASLRLPDAGSGPLELVRISAGILQSSA
jgi:hypothetical protein